MKSEIMEAYLFLRKENMTVPSETLEFMKDATIEKLDSALENTETKHSGLNIPVVSGSTLPTDTDIKAEAKKHAEWDDGTTYQSSIYGFESGAKWMRNKLK